MIKILHVGPSIFKTKGGISMVIKDIVESGKQSESLGITHLASHVDGNKLIKATALLKALVAVASKKNSYDILHIHSASDVSFFRKSLFVLLGRALNKKVVLHMHGGDFDVYYHKSPTLIQYYIRKICLASQQVIVLSDYWKSFFKSILPGKQIEVLPNGVYFNSYEPCRTVPGNMNEFLFMGRLTREKGVYDLVEAANKLVNQHQQNELRFFLAGSGEVEKVKQLVAKYGLKDNVKFLGWIGEREKLEWLQRVGTVLLPSYIEGLPMSIIEAMAGGKVVVCTNIGGIPDLVVEGENGFMFTPGNIDAFCGCISKVLSHPNEMKAISENNIDKIERLHDLPKIHARLFDLYHKISGFKKVSQKEKKPYKYPAALPLD